MKNSKPAYVGLGAIGLGVSLAPKVVANGMVVVGRSSFHRPNCRLVEGKDDLDYAPLAEAQSRGLARVP